MQHRVVRTLALLVPALCLYGAVSGARSADQVAPQVVATVCFMCHTERGDNPYLAFVPRLAAQNSTYILEQLNAFRDGSRADPPATMYMWPMVQNLNDEQLKDAAAWFAAQPAPKPFPADKSADQGRDIYLKGVLAEDVPACVTCHGAKADGNGIFPRLASQNAQYLLAQLRYFRAGVRNDKGADIMKPIALHLSESDMDAVANYLSSL